MSFFKVFIIALALSSATAAGAQRRSTPKSQPQAKYKLPVLKTSIGNYSDTMFLPFQEAAGLIALPLRISDEKNNVFTVSSYSFLYKQIVTTEDDSLNGRPSYTTSIRSSIFKSTPLPALWLSALKENPRPGEEYIFFNVIARDAQHHALYAPNIKLTLK